MAEPSLPEPAHQPELDVRIQVAAFDRELLAQAIFNETNRVRRRLGLKPFQPLAKLNEAADLEAALGRIYQPPSHNNPFPTIGTPLQRVKYVGLEPELVAENIALLHIYESSVVGVVIKDGQRQLVNADNRGLPVTETYRGFATKVVQAWRESPGHRANLVHPGFRYLGCSAQPSVSINGIDQLFCVQVFFTPLVQAPSRR